MKKISMHNISPAHGSCKKRRRIARGYGGKGGGTGGRGTRGQKCRTRGVRPGFEGGQIPLYRRLPKLKGIAGRMAAGLKKFVIINLDDQENTFITYETVTKETLEIKRISKISGRDRKLSFKVLGRGSLCKPLMIKAAVFSRWARASIEAVGGKVEINISVIKLSR